MLVLTRRAGESVVIGDDVVVTVVDVRGDVVRLGIDAPREVKVHREEVYRAVGEANAAAARASEDDVSRLAAALRPVSQPAVGTPPRSSSSPSTPVVDSSPDRAHAPKPGPPHRG